MTAPAATIPVLAAPLLDPGAGRRLLTMPATATIADIVVAAFPSLAAAALDRVRVAMVTAAGSVVVERALWHRVRPRPGVHVVLRLVPGDDSLRTILQVVVSVAAVALGQFWGVGLAGTFGLSAGAWQGIIGLGVTAIGGLLINALVPPVKSDKERASYSITGWRNEMRPDGVVPLVLGKVRYAPPFAASSWSEIAGDQQYVRFLATAGYGRIVWSDLRIGETPIDKYAEAEVQVREGVTGDGAIAYYPRQVYEENIGTELTRPVPRDDAGNPIGSEGVDTPVVRVTGSDAAGACAIFAFPEGLVSFDKEGRKHPMTVLIQVRHRKAGTTDWAYVETCSIQRSQTEGFHVSYEWVFPSRGRWEVEFDRVISEHTSDRIMSRSVLAALQTIRPEYPLAFAKPLALIGGRIRATHQLNGTLDSLNAIVSRVCLDYEHTTGTWVERETSNPAALMRFVLQSGALARPVPASRIDLAVLEDWHDFCRIQGLKYDRVIDFEIRFGDLLKEICAAGRARHRHDGLKWGVVIDRPKPLVVDHINARNSHSFKASRIYLRHPHAFRVKFQDASNDYQPGERIIPWPGHTGPITEVEELELPGKTDPHEVWVEARRRMYEAIHRPDSYSVVYDGASRVATRGDKVMVSTDVIDRQQIAGLVRWVGGRLVELDEAVRMTAGKTYALRWFASRSAEDTTGVSVVRQVMTRPGRTSALTLIGADVPPVGALVHFGEMATIDMPLIVRGVEAGTGTSAVLHLVDAAEIIDTLTDGETPPAWNGRVGGTLDPNLTPPAVPRIAAVRTGIEGTGTLDGLVVFVAPGSGGAVSTSRFQVDHRLGTSGGWTTATVPAAEGGVTITGYAHGDTVQIRARALSPQGTPSGYGATVTVVVGAQDGALPDALAAELVAVAGGMGSATVTWTATGDEKTKRVQVYCSTSLTLDRAADAVGAPISTTPGLTAGLIIGDGSRTNLASNANFASGAADWTLGADWSVTDGQAVHAAGSTADLKQTLSLTAGGWYRLGFLVRDLSAGFVRPVLAGGTEVTGANIGAAGAVRTRLQAAAGNNALAFRPTSAFEGAIDDVVVYLETTSCLSQGTHYVWLEPQNENGLPGPALGPIAVIVT